MGDRMKRRNYAEDFSRATAEIKEKIEDRRFREASKQTPESFTRERKMGFVDITKFVLNLPRRPLPVELDEYYGKRHISKQAFSKARAHIKWEAFREIARTSSKATLERTKDSGDYRGMRVFAVDGSKLEVPNTTENLIYFGKQGSANACRAQMSALLHISSGIVADAEIAPLKTDERTLASNHIEYLKTFSGGRDLMLYDRGYPSKKLIGTLEDSNMKYLMRVQKSFSKEVDENPSHDFHLILPYRKGSLNVRVVRVVLETGEIENLLTNLCEDEFPTECFKELYFMRWSIESKYHTLKNKLLIEHFSGKTRLSVQQDFYATVCAANLVTLAKNAADEEISIENEAKDLKHTYQANEKLAVKKVRDRLLIILAEDNPTVRSRLFDCLVADIARDRSPIRPGRHFPRPPDSHHRRKLCTKSVF
jgi:hypothetical protein